MKFVSEYFIIGLFVTMIVLYFISPDPEVIVKYPNVSDSVSPVYVDDSGVCYRYHRMEVEKDTDQK